MGELALLIPIIALMIPFWAIYHSNQTKRERMRMQHEAAGFGELGTDIARRLERMEQRVAVLERIATDKSSTLSDEIEALRRRG
jgi:hypothetical protein